jgi:predicted nuclease of restriction endonuclease-like (RecB) superfamily
MIKGDFKMQKNTKITQSSEYRQWLKELKGKVRGAQLKAATAVNTALLEFYWNLGEDIADKQKNATWGSGFLSQLSKDLMAEFPNIKGFSLNNLQYIRRWYFFYYSPSLKSGTGCSTIDQKCVSCLFQIPWGHNLNIISKCKTVEKALFYVQKTIENNWSRSVLIHQIESDLFARKGKAITNFENTLA